jgi:hypothetical protein
VFLKSIGAHEDVSLYSVHTVSISNVAVIVSRERSVFLRDFLCLSSQKRTIVMKFWFIFDPKMFS